MRAKCKAFNSGGYYFSDGEYEVENVRDFYLVDCGMIWVKVSEEDFDINFDIIKKQD